MDAGGLTTDELMRLSLEMAGMSAVPGDSAVYVPGIGLRRLMVGIDVGTAELVLARHLGVDGVVAHNPAGGAAILNFSKVLGRQIELLVEAGVPTDRARLVVQPAIAAAVLRAQAANHDHTAVGSERRVSRGPSAAVPGSTPEGLGRLSLGLKRLV